jgi:hypothetical protein
MKSWNSKAVQSSLFSHPYKINPVVLTNDIYKHRFLRDFSVGRYIPNAPSYVFASFPLDKIMVLLSNGNWSAPAYGGNYLKTKQKRRMEHSEYIYQLRNHVRNGACRYHWSTLLGLFCTEI